MDKKVIIAAVAAVAVCVCVFAIYSGAATALVEKPICEPTQPRPLPIK